MSAKVDKKDIFCYTRFVKVEEIEILRITNNCVQEDE